MVVKSTLKAIVDLEQIIEDTNGPKLVPTGMMEEDPDYTKSCIGDLVANYSLKQTNIIHFLLMHLVVISRNDFQCR